MARVTESVDAARAAAERFFAEDGGESARDRLVMARALGLLFVAGALIGLVSLALPHDSDARIGAIAGVCGLALVLGIVCIYERGRLPAWAFPGSCLAAIVMISVAVYLSDGADSPYAFYFVLVAMFAAYFLSLRQLALQLACIAIAYPVVIDVLGGGDESGQRWLL